MIEKSNELLISKIKRIAHCNKYFICRWIKHSYKILFYYLLLYTKKTVTITTSTFWNGKMQIILPEKVSYNIWRNKYFDESVSIFLLKYLKINDNFIDIGAHYGFYSLLGSYLVGPNGRVISFEPTPSTFNILNSNTINFASYDNIEAYNYAVFSTEKVINFKDFGVINSAFNTLTIARTSEDIQSEEIKVKSIILDNFIQKYYSDLKINLIKIDAESAELEILYGSKGLINKYHPKIILELGDLNIELNSNTKKLVDFMQSLGYRPFGYINGVIKEIKQINFNQYNNFIFISND